MRNHSTGSARIVPARDFTGPAFVVVATNRENPFAGHVRRAGSDPNGRVILIEDNGNRLSLAPNQLVLVMNGTP